MAKIRRTIRKLPGVALPDIAEQLWPIYVALVLFGGLLAGVVLAYLRFDDPLWYRNAILWLLVIPVVIGSAMVALYFVNTRFMRRAVQLAMVLSIVAHFLVFWLLYLQHMPFDSLEETDKSLAQKTPETVRISVEQLTPVARPQPRDFERPVETADPEVAAQPLDRTQREPDPQTTPDLVQPAPEDVAKTQPTPQATARATVGETAPRFSAATSQLSRQVSQAAPTTNRSADAPQVAAQSQAEQLKPAVAIAKQEAATSPRSADNPPTAVEPTKETQLTRRDAQREPQPETPPASKVARATTSSAPPSTALAPVESPAIARATDTRDPTPRVVSPDKRATAAPQVAQATPTPETPSEVQPRTQRRAVETPTQPTLAQAQASVPNPRPRETTRPNIAAVASAEPTAQTPQQASQEATTGPQSTAIAKSSSTPATNATAQAVAAPSATPTVSATSGAGKASAVNSPDPAAAAAVMRSPRTAAAPGITTSTSAEPAQVAVASTAGEGQLSPTATGVRKEATQSPATALAAGTPAAAAVRGAASESPAALASQRRADNAPTTAENAELAAIGRTASRAALNAASTAAPTASEVGATAVAEITSLSPAASQVARQPTSAPGATASQQPLAVATQSTNTQIAAASASKASAASLPTLDPNSAPTASPARARSAAEAVASPENIETPSIAATATGDSSPTAQPARMALTKSLAGVAGVGQSTNLDRSQPAADSPALVASGSARRELATQSTPQGPALSPSSASLAGRSRASAVTPSAHVKADTLDTGSQAGAEQIAKVEASAGASLAKQDANATQAAVTATPGQIEIDLGPTQIVADSGNSSRASGGGQPTVNTQSTSKQLAKREVGGSAAAALASNTKAEIPAAPSGTGGGAPQAPDVNVKATELARTDAGGAAPVSGAPAAAAQRGPATEVNTASLVGASAPAKRDDQAPGGAPQVAGQPNTSADQDRASRVARTAGGAPELAVGGPVTAEVANIPRGQGAPAGDAAPASTAVAKTTDGGAAAAAPANDLATPSVGGVVAAASVGRAEAVEAAPGAPAPGGGENKPTRRATGPAIAANAVADVPSTTGSPVTGGNTEAAANASVGATRTSTSGAVAATATSEPGPSGGQVAPTGAVGQRAAATEPGAAPIAMGATQVGSPSRKAASVALAAGTSTAAEVIGGGGAAQAAGANPLAGMERGQMTRQETTGAIAVNVPAEAGPGGLGAEVASDVGINSRRATAESMDVQVADARFQRQKIGGDLNVNTAAVVATDGFRQRGPVGRGSAGSGAPQTEESIELGLIFLREKQLSDGSWSLQGHDDFSNSNVTMIASDTAATALALLAFEGAGYTHREHKYKDAVNAGLEFLIKNQQQNGDLFVRMDDTSNGSAWLYSHALATLALCEAYGMTGDPALRIPAQKAINFVVASQNKERGGWRYKPGVDADTSVTGWMMMALKSGEMARLEVPPATLLKIRKWTEVAAAGPDNQHQFRYNPWAPTDQVHGRVASKTMTSVGLLMQLYLGAKKDSAAMRLGGDYLLANPPALAPWDARRDAFTSTPRDTYYWYYATQVMWHLGGEYRERWLAQMHPLLLQSQQRQGPNAGSWDPVTPVPDRWGWHAGRLYVTTMNLLSLEVRYRYLPIYTEGK